MASITRAWQFCLDACNADNVFYSMDSTLRTLYNYAGGPPYYCDCSSLMCYSVLAGGFEMPGYNSTTKNPFSTDEEPDALLSAGWVNIGIPSELRPGDIGHIYRSERSQNSGHTEMCYSGGAWGEALFMGAHMNYGNTAKDVCVDSSPSTMWKRVFRYEGYDDETGTDNPTNRTKCPYPVAAAIAGNFYIESTINPGIWEFHDGRGFEPTTLLQGYGLGQWTNTGGDTQGRLYQLLTWLDGHNYSWGSGSGQVAYMCGEEKSWNTYNWWQSQFNINSFDEFLFNTSDDIEMLTTAWCYCWEGISEYNVSWDFQLSKRIEKAKYYYDYIQEHEEDTNINSWYSFDGYCTEEQIENNAVMLFRALNNYTMAQSSTTGDSGNNTPGDSGTPGKDEASFTDFLMAGLSRQNNIIVPKHIIQPPKK